MAFLFVDSLAKNNNRFVKISGKILELLLLSVGLFSTVMVMKDYSCQIVFSSLMGFFTSIKCFLSSPSLTIIITINLIVFLIFASSAFHSRRDPDNDLHPTTLLPHPHDLDHDIQITHHESPPPSPLPPPPPPPSCRDIVEVTPPPPPQPQPQPPETAPSSNTLQSLFSNQDLIAPPRPPSPTAPPLEEETMEATWEAITGGGKQKAKKKKHLKKSETWEAAAPPPRRLDSEEVVPSSPKWKELRKAETFDEAVSVTRRGGLIRDHSMSLEEFNKKVETFIKNFNDSMRLQRQESKKKFLGIINQKRF